MTDATKTIPTAKRTRKSAAAKAPASASATKSAPSEQHNPTSPRAPTKASIVEALLQQDGGASLDALCQVTGWLPHTCRAFLTGLRKKGRTVERSKREDGTTIYRLAAAQDAA